MRQLGAKCSTSQKNNWAGYRTNARRTFADTSDRDNIGNGYQTNQATRTVDFTPSSSNWNSGEFHYAWIETSPWMTSALKVELSQQTVADLTDFWQP